MDGKFIVQYLLAVELFILPLLHSRMKKYVRFQLDKCTLGVHVYNLSLHNLRQLHARLFRFSGVLTFHGKIHFYDALSSCLGNSQRFCIAVLIDQYRTHMPSPCGKIPTSFMFHHNISFTWHAVLLLAYSLCDVATEDLYGTMVIMTESCQLATAAKLRLPPLPADIQYDSSNTRTPSFCYC